MSPVTLNDFSRLAGQTAAADLDTTFLKVGDDKLSQTGSVGNFFTTQATRRETIDAFVGALRAEYGDHVADMINNTAVAALRDAGKPLSARLVQDLTRLAETEKARVNAHNQEAVNTFVNGPGLDEAVSALFARGRVTSPQDQTALKERVKNFLLDKAGQGGFYPNLLSADALRTNVGLGLPSFTGLSAGHKEVLSPSLPGTLQDRLGLADMGLGKTAPNSFALKRAVEKLEAMRQIQPEGKITPETAYRAFFNREPPMGLGGDELLEAIETRCGQDKEKLLARRAPGIRDNLIDGWTPQMMPWERFASLATRPNALTTDEAKFFVEGQWSGNNSRTPQTVQRYLRLDPFRVRQGEDMPAPTFSFRFPNDEGETETQRIEVGRNSTFAFSDDKDKTDYLSGKDNSLSRKLENLAGEICAPDASDLQRTRVMYCLTQGPLIPLRQVASLAGTTFDEHSNVSVSLTRQPDGSIRVDFASPEEGRDAQGHFSMSLTLAKDGAMTLEEFELVPPLEIRQQREDEATARESAARYDQSMATAAPFRALDDSPDGLFARIRERALALDPGARLDANLWTNVDSAIGRRLETMIRTSAEPLTPEQILAARTNVLDEFFGKLEQAAAQLPQEQRGVFTRGCLELGEVPDAALVPVMTQMASTVASAFGAILEARNGNEVRELLSDLSISMRSATTLNPDFADRGADFFTPAHLLAMRMGLVNLMGEDDPQVFARALIRPGPFRDMLHGAVNHPDEMTNTFIRNVLGWFNGGMTRVLPDEMLMQTLNSYEVRERDLSLPRQREILGEGVYVARGAEMAVPALAGLNRSLARDMPAIREDIRAQAETDLRQGPGNNARADSGLSQQFVVDYQRGGVFVNGRHYNPRPAAQAGGTGTTEQDFIRLFPDARTAGLLSNLAAQNLPAMVFTALMRDHQLMIEHSVASQSLASAGDADGRRQQNMRIDTLDAEQGRYRVSALLSLASNDPASGVERYLQEVSVDVNLGAPGLDESSRPPPSVEAVHVDVLLRGREVVPGEE